MTGQPIPSGSAAFDPGVLGIAPGLDLGDQRGITREWAFGASRGAGIKVAVIDSGIDAAHVNVGSIQGGVVLEHDEDAPRQRPCH